MDKEPFSWSKFLGGLFSPLQAAKSLVIGFQITCWALLIMCIVFTGFWLKSKINKPKTVTAPVSISGMSGGNIHNSNDTINKKYGLLNLFG